MPIIPRLQNPGPLANAPAPVLDRNQRPTLDTSGAQRALLQFHESNKAPLMDPQALSAPYEALEGVGRAIAQAGDVVKAAAMKERDSIMIRQQSEARVATAQALGDLEQRMSGEAAMTPEAWNGMAQETFKGLREKLAADKNLLPQARERIMMSLDMESAEYMRGLGARSQKANHGLARDAIDVELDLAIKNQNEEKFRGTLGSAAFRERFFPHEVRIFEERYRARGIEKGNEAAENQFKTAVMMADEKVLDAAMKTGKERGGWDEDYIKVKRLAGMEGIERTKAVVQSRSEAEFLGEVFMRKARGEVIVPNQIENWVNENKIDKDSGARLLVAVKSEQGAMQGEFYDFLNSAVDQYDPKTDPDGVKSYELQKQAAMLGLNGPQMSLFEARLQRAAKMNGPQRAQQVVLSAGKKFIGDMLKDVGVTRAWDSDAEALFKDPAKLEAFGVPKDAAKEIEKLTKGEFSWGGDPTGKGVDKAKALELFKRHAETRSASRPAGLTDAEWQKMLTLSTAEPSASRDAAISAEFDRAILEEGLESWYNHELNKRGTPPDGTEVKKWVGDKTRAVLQGVGAANLFKLPQTSAVMGGGESQRYTKLADGTYEGTASSYGYAGDADNGFNSLGMMRGEQPWYGSLPTVALAPAMAEELGVELPRKKKDGTWDWSKSVVEIEAGGKMTKAIFDETGMYLVEASKDKLIDLTPEASEALGLPIKTNAKVKVRKPQS